MIYRPQSPRQLWDSWLFPWNGRYHLFFLESHGDKWDHVGRAVSQDLVHWETLPSIHTRGKPGEWNHWGSLTGTVVPHDGRFHLFVGSIPDQQEVIGRWISDDLEQWREGEGNPVIVPAAPYLTERAQAPYWPVDLRDPCIFWREADHQYHAVMCARQPAWDHHDTGAVLAHACSPDLRNWRFLPPLASLGHRFFHSEVPDWFELNGYWYLTFNTLSLGGIKINTPTREGVTGAFYLKSRCFDHDFALPDDPFLIGCGRPTDFRAYSARTVPHQGGRILYHHVKAARPAWGAPKQLRSGPDGTLTLDYLPALEKLETRVICDALADLPMSKLDLGVWQVENGRLRGDAGCTGTAFRVAAEAGDLHLQVRLQAFTAAGAGIVLRADARQGVAVILDFERQRIQIGDAVGYEVIKKSVGPFEAWQAKIQDFQLRRLELNREYHLRIFVRDVHYEVYLDNQWIFTSVFEELPRAGNVELCVERGVAAFSELRLAALEPLP